jgi:phosphoribosyl 1,2-cyclic phosphodiesterase
MEVYCSRATFESVKATFPYMVDSAQATGGGDVPAFNWNIIPSLHDEFYIPSCNVSVMPLPVEHGCYFDETRSPFICLGFQIADLCYVSDASRIPPRTRAKIQGCNVLVLDALKWTPHPSHFSIPEALDFVQGLEQPPRKTYFVDFTHEIDHYAFEAYLRSESKLELAPAYDGLQVLFGDKGERTEVDLLGQREWVAVSEADGAGDEVNGVAKIKTMV